MHAALAAELAISARSRRELAAEIGASGGGVTSGLARVTPSIALLRALLAARHAQQPPPAAHALLLLRSLLLPALHLVRCVAPLTLTRALSPSPNIKP